MPNRPSRAGRTPGANGRSSIDVGGMIGAAGAGMGGAGDAAVGSMSPETATAQGYDTPAAKAYMGGAATSNVGSMPVVTKPGFFANMATHGQAGLQYQNYLQQLALQQVGGGQALDQIKVKGDVEQKTQSQKGDIEAKAAKALDASQQAQMILKQHMSDMQARGIAFDPATMQSAIDALHPTEMAAAMSKSGREATEAGNAAEFAKSSTGKQQQAVGQGGAYLKTAFDNLTKIPVLGMGQTANVNFPGANYNASGSQPFGNTSTKRTTMDPKTGMPTETDTTQTMFKPGSFNMRFGGDLALPPVDDKPPVIAASNVLDDQEERQLASPAISVKPTMQSGGGYQPGLLTPSPDMRNSMYQQAQGMGAQQQGTTEAITNLLKYLFGSRQAQ